jgi:Outer membrane protein beta-barrel domain
MKKSLYLLGIILLPFCAISQVKFGVQGGFALSKTEMNNTFSDLTVNYKLGPLAGIMVGVNLGESNFSLMQEMNLVFKGAKIKGTDNSQGTPVPVEGSHTTRYIEFPLNILFYMPTGKGHFFFGAGPYGALGIGGNNKLIYYSGASPEAEDISVKFGSETDQLKKFDFGVHGLLGYKLGYGSYVKAFYSHGLANLTNLEGLNYANRYFGLSFGYFFGSGR